MDAGSLTTIAGIISAFGVAMLFYRIPRELHMREIGQPNWFPWADWLPALATLLCLFGVLLPITFSVELKYPAAASAAATVMIAGYFPALMGHYRIVFRREFVIFGKERQGERDNPEPSELFFVILTGVLTVAIAAIRLGCWGFTTSN